MDTGEQKEFKKRKEKGKQCTEERKLETCEAKGSKCELATRKDMYTGSKWKLAK